MSNLYESFKKADIGLIFMKVKKMSAIDLFYTKVLKNTVINLFTRTAKYRHSSVYTKAKKKVDIGPIYTRTKKIAIAFLLFDSTHIHS